MSEATTLNLLLLECQRGGDNYFYIFVEFFVFLFALSKKFHRPPRSLGTILGRRCSYCPYVTVAKMIDVVEITP